jgi:hypothetical protein
VGNALRALVTLKLFDRPLWFCKTSQELLKGVVMAIQKSWSALRRWFPERYVEVAASKQRPFKRRRDHLSVILEKISS